MNPPAKIIRKYYFFDIKNSKDILNGKSKPKLVQRGPYAYSEVVEKKNIKFLNKKTLSYTPVVKYYFEPNLSDGDENDLVTVLNVPAVVNMLKKTCNIF